MKQRINIFPLLIALLANIAIFTACSKDEEPQQNTIEVVNAATFFPVEGGEKEVTLAQAVDSAYAEDGWLTVKNEGAKIVLQTTLNPNETSRSTLLVLKNKNGVTLNISVTQEGIYYGLPQDQVILTNDKAITKQMRVGANVPMNYSSTANWIKVNYNEGILKVETTENTTGEARVGWVVAQVDVNKLPNKGNNGTTVEVKTDSLRVVQASIDNFVGEYTQVANTLDETQKLVTITSKVVIEKINATRAKFIVDNTYTWEIDFKNGVGFTLTNGKVVRTSTDKNGKPLYSLSVIVADDYSNGHNTALNGVKDQLFLNVNDEGKLEFVDAVHASKEQLFRGYGWNNYSVKVPEQSALQGVEKVYIQPKLTKVQ